MDEALELNHYLPVSFAAQAESDYLKFLWEAFQDNYENGKFEFASLAFHLLYMSFVSFSVWQIKLARAQDFKNALIGFQSEAESKLLEADSPFKFYERLKESQIFRFMKIIGCTNEHVGEFAKFVRRRNKIAHPSGTVFFNDQRGIDQEITEMMREIINIQNHMQPVILALYESFLRETPDIEEREYADPKEEIEANFIHKFYISEADLRVCAEIELGELSDLPNFQTIMELHEALLQIIPEEEETAA